MLKCFTVFCLLCCLYEMKAFYGFLAKTAFKFVRSAATVAVKVAAKSILKKPVLEFAGEVVEQVAAEGKEYIKEKLDEWRIPPEPTTERPLKEYILCVGEDSDTCAWSKVQMRSFPADIIHKLLNDLADPNRTLRNHINTIMKQLERCRNEYRQNSMNSASLLRQVTTIATKLVGLCDSLAITSIEE